MSDTPRTKEIMACVVSAIHTQKREEMYAFKEAAEHAIAALERDLAERTAELMAAIHHLPGDVLCGDLQRAKREYQAWRVAQPHSEGKENGR